MSGDGPALLAMPVFAPSSVSGTTALPAQERLQSCDPRIAIAAAKEIVNNPDTFKEPLELFTVAGVLFRHGQKDAGVYWFYAAQLRVRHQLIFEQGDRAQLMSVMMMTFGPSINNYAFQDLSNLDRLLDRMLAWDAKAPNPFRGRPRSPEIDRQIAQIYTGLRDFRAKLVAEKNELERQARLAAPEIARMDAQTAPQCHKDQIDPATAAQATRDEWPMVLAFVKRHEGVAREAGEITAVYPEMSMVRGTMPERYVVSIVGVKRVSAVVDVSRSSANATFTLACVTHVPSGKRVPFKDICAQ